MSQPKKESLLKNPVFWFVAITSLLILFISVVAYIAVRSAPLEFEAGTKWYSSDPTISLEVDENGVPRGYIVIDGKERKLAVYTRARSLFLELEEDTPDAELILVGTGRVTDKKVVISNFSHVDEKLKLTVKEIVLERQ